MKLFEALALSDPEWAAAKARKAIKAMLRMWPRPNRLQRDLIKVVASVEALGETVRELQALVAQQETQLERARTVEQELNTRIDEIQSV